MAKLKTRPNERSVAAFLASVTDPLARADCEALVALMSRATKAEPRMWGPSIVGFGTYHYVYESGREGDWFLTGFAPRKGNLTLYFMDGLHEHAPRLGKLGTFKTGKGCLYVKRLADLDAKVLATMVTEAVRRLRDREKASRAGGRAAEAKAARKTAAKKRTRKA